MRQGDCVIKLREAVKAVGIRKGTCWCGIKTFKLIGNKKEYTFHSQDCDALYLALYGGERE